ncbi:hypothetical protein FRC00_010162, partial [Tulasnella sp. 408]
AQASKLSTASFSAVDIINTINRFYAYASQSLFFTKGLTEINALRRTADHKSTLVWSVKSSREALTQVGQSEINAVKLTLRLRAPHNTNVMPEHWLVTSAQVAKEVFPSRFHPLFSPHRLPTPTFGLALSLSARLSATNSRLFATLPLPVSTSLPVHINATWILAQDRRSIRYDAPDATGQRPLDTLYNEYLLMELIAPLYVKTLALVLLHHPKLARQFWPGKAQDGPSRVIATEIHKRMVSTKEAVLLSAQNQPISPSNAIIHLSRKVPMSIRTILTELQVPNYVPYPYFDTSFLEDWGSLRFDVAKEFSRILRHNAAALKKLWPTRDPTNPAFTFKELLSATDYLLKERESLEGLPLLLRGDGELVEFQSSGRRKIFASHRSDLARLFDESVIVHLNFSDAAAQGLAKLNLNVADLDPQGMRELLAHEGRAISPASTKIVSKAELEWHKRLLEFLASPACPVKLEDVADLPLLPAFGRELVVSLNHANGGGVWWRSRYEDRNLTAILLQLGVVEVDVPPGGTQGANTADLAGILRLFGQLSLSPTQILKKVASEDWNGFVEYLKLWVQVHYITKLSPAEFQTLTALPLFQGRQGINELPFVPASQVLMLPESAELNTLARYLPPGQTFAEHSSHLAAIFQRGKATKKRKLSFENLLGQLRIPHQLAQDEESSFSALLQLIATHHVGRYNNQLIPNGNRVLRRPSELFDHRVELFSTAFEGRQDLFVHPNFRGSIDRLVDLGVQSEITSQRLLECLRAVDRDARQGQDLVRRASWLWDYINAAPPQLRQIAFDTIRGLRFLPRQAQRHPSDPDFDTYARDLPNVVSLDDLCTLEHEPVVWTQRARFSSLPSAHLKAIYPNIGEPAPVDVVQHLVSLDNWTWRAADQVVFDLTYDVDGRFVARKFLLPFRSLLVEAGAHEYRVASLPSTKSAAKTSHPEMIRAGWNDLRQTGQLLDICFQVDGQEVPAHRGMLAAAIPHFKTAFAGSFRESVTFAEGSELPVYPLPGEEAESAFAVQAIVDANAALDDLLDLMELSNLWDVSELTSQAVQAIVELRLIRFDNCDRILERAEECQIKVLITICQETKKQNKWA